jgi:two-component system nitrate/nitrite response regulator NarL
VRTLVCDDHRLFGDLVAKALLERGHDVVAVCETPEEAVTLTASTRPDLAVVDLVYGVDERTDLVEELHAASPSLYVFVLTARSSPDLLQRLFSAGAAGVGAKTRGMQDLLDAVERVAAGDTWADPNLVRAMLVPSPATEVATALGTLTDREAEVLDRLAEGQSTSTMATEMHVSVTTVRTHVRSVLQKLGVHSRLEAVAMVAALRRPSL